jgi:2-methylcitrate dehydratase PrpD
MVESEKGISRQCADFIAHLKYEDLDERTVQSARKYLLDWLGCVLAGSTTPAASMIGGLVEEMGGNPHSTLVGSFRKSSVLQAAMVNGYNCHILEMDDVHKESITHPAAPVISAAFSLAEKLGSSGRDLLTAIVAGYDVMIRIGEAVTPSHYRIWHTTATCGAFGSAAAASSLLGLGEAQALDALGNAGSQAAGLWEFATDKAMTKFMHCGNGARNGLFAALMASRGFTGAQRILEGDRGFFRATSKEKDEWEHFSDLFETFRINDVSIKPYAACRHAHGAINGVLELKARHGLAPEEVDSIVVETYSNATRMAGNTGYGSEQEAKFSTAYCVACAVVRGKVGPAEFSEEARHDPVARELAARVKLVVADDLDALHPQKWPSRIRVKTKAGQEYNHYVEYPKGDPENPVSAPELEEKFFDLAGLALTREQSSILCERCRNIESLRDAREFFSGFGEVSQA